MSATIKAHRLLRLVAALAMLAALVRPFGNPTVCAMAGHRPDSVQHQHGSHAPVVASDHDDSCHEQMGCGLATLGLKLQTQPAIPTLPTHEQDVGAALTSPQSSTQLPLTPPPRA